MNSPMPEAAATASTAPRVIPASSHRCAVPERDQAPVCRASGLAAILLERPDVPATVAWLADFGLTPVAAASDYALLRGARSRTPCVVIRRGKARYAGLSLYVDNREDLVRLARATNTRVETNDAQRGGERVRLTDPDGLIVEAIHGCTELAPLPIPQRTPANHVDNQPRINATVRFTHAGVPAVSNLGHTVLGVRNFSVTARWYQHHFGFIVSDFQLMRGDDIPVVAFLRCDRGDTPTDHHTLALSSAVDIGHLHTAFELDDFDDVARAHECLQAKQRRHSWGIGRHILGSQIFDYWRDDSGDLFEHYADGDRFDAFVPTGYHAFGGDTLHQWGPAPSADMVGKVPTPARAKTLLTRLRDKHDDLTPARLLRLMKASG